MRNNCLRRALLFAVATLGPLLASCKATVPTGEPVTITFACMSYLYGQYADLAERFHEQNPDVIVQIVSADEAREVETGTDLVFLAQTADTFLFSVPRRYRLRQQQSALLELLPFIQADRQFNLDDFYPSMLEVLQLGDASWGLPVSGNVGVIYYDKDAFDAAGLSYPQPGWTWDEFVQTAEQFTVRDGDRVTRYGFVDLMGTPMLISLALQRAGTLWDEQEAHAAPRLQDPKVAEALEWYVALATTYEVMPDPVKTEQDHLQAMVRDKQAAMWTDTIMDYDSYRRDPDLRIGIAPLPERGKAAHPMWIRGYFVSAGTRHPQASWRWIKFLSQQPVEQYYLIPARRSIASASFFWQDLDEGNRAALEYMLAHAATPNDETTQGLEVALLAVLEDGKSTDEALALAQEEAVALLKTSAVSPLPVIVAQPEPTPEPSQTHITFFPRGDWQRATYQKLVPQLEALYPDIDVYVESPPSLANDVSWDDYLQKLKREADCFALTGGFSPLTEGVLELGPFIDADSTFSLDDFPPSILARFTTQGSLWALPYGSSPVLLFYHRDLFAAARVEPPGPDWTVDDFMSAALALSNLDEAKEADRIYGFQAFESDYLQSFHSFLLSWYDTAWIDTSEATVRPFLNSPATIEAMERFRTLAREGMYPLPVDLDGDMTLVIGGHTGKIDTGQVAMWVNWWWLQDKAPSLPFEVGVAPWSQLNNAFVCKVS
ncbi:MAG: extracellular solute-binding protein [Chloroflexota bacterium]|nr:extracellular solute-binding protein [Chloroflexota bacterium]